MTSDLPSGTATFVFTDIEGSTKLLQQEGENYTKLLDDHRRLLREAFEAHNGREMRTEGDAFFIVFKSAGDAVTACVDGQRALAVHEWPPNAVIRVRIGVHTGEANVVGDDYVGIDVHRAARIGAAAHGGQVLVSESVKTLVERSLPAGVQLHDLGEHRLKDLARAEHLYQLDVDGLRTDFPPIKTLQNTPNNLPLQATTFVGRDRDLKAARALFEKSRLLTLTGPGGTGKSRLALQLAAEVSDAFPDGVYFVRLAPIGDPQLVGSTITQTLGLREGQDAVDDRLMEHLGAKRILLLLDNFEQLLPAAPLVGRIVTEAPGVKVLVTSRAPLRVYGEQEFQVPPLDLPDPSHANAETLSQYDSVKLFIERASAAKPDFQVTNENAPAVAAICARLDGLPLAIELAAARIRLLTPQAILPRLERALETLSSGARDLPARQQTLRGAIAWSYDLLDEPARSLFARLSVFRGGASLDQIEAVCSGGDGDVLDDLQELVEHSVLRQAESVDEPRFWMLVTIREFAGEKLRESGEEPAVRDRHADAMCALAQEAEPKLTGPDQKQWLDRLDLNLDNLRVALDWLVESGNASGAMALAGAAWRFWQMRGRIAEARRRLEHILQMPGSHDDLALRARALDAAGGLAYWQGDRDGSRDAYMEALDVSRQVGDKPLLANAVYNSAFPDTVLPGGDVPAGTARLEEALQLYRELGDEAGVAKSLWGLASAAYFIGSVEGSIARFSEALPLFERLHDRFQLGWTHRMRGVAQLELGHVEPAAADFRAALRIFADAADASGAVLLLDDLSRVAKERGDAERALRLTGARAALQAQTGVSLSDVLVDRLGRPTLDLLPLEEAKRVYAEGEAMSMSEAVDYALGHEAPAAEPK